MKLLQNKIALVDDHILFRKGIKELITKFSGYSVMLEADNGEDFCNKMITAQLPEIVIVDLHMPKMDGVATAKWLQKNHPQIQVIILSMSQDEKSVLQLLKSGVKGYLLKESNPDEFKKALDDVKAGGYYYPEFVTQYLLNHVKSGVKPQVPQAKSRDADFLKLVATDLTYKEIADKMNVSVRTVDGYRDQLFEKFDVKSRVGLVIYALKNNLIKI